MVVCLKIKVQDTLWSHDYGVQHDTDRGVGDMTSCILCMLSLLDCCDLPSAAERYSIGSDLAPSVIS